MTPNLGQGANMAIEDAAALATLLSSLLKRRGNLDLPSTAQIESLLQQYRQARYRRVCSVYNQSRFLVRLQARDGLFHTLFGRYYAPYAGDLPADVASETIAGGGICEFIPRSSKDRWRVYHRRRGSGRAWLGLIFGLVLLLLLSRYGGYKL
jgi:FAD dependent monooxygenase